MIRPEDVFVAIAPVDLRWGTEKLSAYVQNALDRSPCDGSAFAFTNRQRTRIKLLIWDGTGVWLCHRQLHKGSFNWPGADDQLFHMKLDVWQWLIAGVEWQRLVANPPFNFRV